MPRWMRRWVYSVYAICLGSGAGWLVFHFWVPYRDIFGPAPHPLLPKWLALHGASAVLMAALLGLLWLPHVRAGWRGQRNRGSGAMLLATLALLAASGWGLYYLADERIRPWLSTSHWALGLATAGLLAWHVIRARRRGITPRLRTTAPSPSPAHPHDHSGPGNSAAGGRSR